ncbi:MAG: response regulator [Candidatus Pseudobacter hemicellulosilyticus]|uniref:Response regulator n=1 Tax=Candidatus Pseudobacter hemicellulosilyticus TaxID=3121375 RepID=A0AAJ5WWJ5_9BACT|nr:MAG: response regulator [Pseudobacter sp.]
MNAKPVLLIVDDNQEIIDFLAEDLGEKYTVLTASNGREALALLAQETVQLVISDVMMPEIDGFELCRQIKTNFESSHVPVILLTARNNLQSRIDGLELGADAYIDKPFSPEYLQVQVANLLKNRSKLKEFYAHSPATLINTMAHTRADETFLDELNNIVQSHMEDTSLDVEQLAKHLNMSRPTLYRKLKAITDLTPNELINITRLKKAAVLLTQGEFNINEISEMVGYTSPTHFGRNFQKQFGQIPSEFRKKKE